MLKTQKKKRFPYFLYTNPKQAHIKLKYKSQEQQKEK